MLTLAIFLIILLVFGAQILRLAVKIFSLGFKLMLSAAVLVVELFGVFFGLLAGVILLVLQKLIPFLAKHLSNALPWIVSAFATFGIVIYAGFRNIFHGEKFIDFIKKSIPHKISSRRKDFSLLLIEVADSIHTDILEKFETQYQKVLNFFKPVNDGE